MPAGAGSRGQGWGMEREPLSPSNAGAGPCCCHRRVLLAGAGAVWAAWAPGDRMWLLDGVFYLSLNRDPISSSFSRGQQKAPRQLLPRFYIPLLRSQLRKGLPHFIVFFNIWVEQHSVFKASFLEVAEQFGLKLFWRLKEEEKVRGVGRKKKKNQKTTKPPTCCGGCQPERFLVCA